MLETVIRYFFANHGTENWIIHGFEVMKGNETRASDRITLKIEPATQMQKKYK